MIKMRQTANFFYFNQKVRKAGHSEPHQDESFDSNSPSQGIIHAILFIIPQHIAGPVRIEVTTGCNDSYKADIPLLSLIPDPAQDFRCRI